MRFEVLWCIFVWFCGFLILLMPPSMIFSGIEIGEAYKSELSLSFYLPVALVFTPIANLLLHR